VSVKVVRAYLDDTGNGTVIRGAIDIDSLKALEVGSYQREVQPVTTLQKIKRGYAQGVVPDIFLSMRGTKVRRGQNDGEFFLLDPTFIVDGLQRVTAAIQIVNDPTATTRPNVGAEVHLGRDEAWEREMFRILNLERTRLSSNVIIRNAAEDCSSASALLKLAGERDFALRDRICFGQNMRREHLITAVTYLKIAGTLHSRFGASLSSDVLAIVGGLDRIVDGQAGKDGIGERAFRENVRTFFNVIRDVWGLSQITVRETCPYIKYGFLHMLSLFITRMPQLWDDDKKRFRIERDVLKKMEQFPLNDPTVRDLCSASGQAEKVLYQMFLEHMNRGRRTNRFVDHQLLASLGGRPVTEADNGTTGVVEGDEAQTA